MAEILKSKKLKTVILFLAIFLMLSINSVTFAEDDDENEYWDDNSQAQEDHGRETQQPEVVEIKKETEKVEEIKPKEVAPSPVVLPPQVSATKKTKKDEAQKDLNPAVNTQKEQAKKALKQESSSTNQPSVNVNYSLDQVKDSDLDGVPDYLDLHPGEDDYAFLIIDDNHNGIADELEILLK